MQQVLSAMGPQGAQIGAVFSMFAAAKSGGIGGLLKGFFPQQ